MLQTELSKAVIKEGGWDFLGRKVDKEEQFKIYGHRENHDRSIDRGGKRHSCKEKKEIRTLLVEKGGMS